MLYFTNMKPEKKNVKCNIITQAHRSRCSSHESHEVRSESQKIFQPVSIQ